MIFCKYKYVNLLNIRKENWPFCLKFLLKKSPIFFLSTSWTFLDNLLIIYRICIVLIYIYIFAIFCFAIWWEKLNASTTSMDMIHLNNYSFRRLSMWVLQFLSFWFYQTAFGCHIFLFQNYRYSFVSFNWANSSEILETVTILFNKDFHAVFKRNCFVMNCSSATQNPRLSHRYKKPCLKL